MALRDMIIDAWSNLAYKGPLRDDAVSRVSGIKPRTWVPEEDRRRLMAYMVLAAYESNMAGNFISGTVEDKSSNREYGDAALVIDSVLAALIGESQEIVVPGAEDYDLQFAERLERAQAAEVAIQGDDAEPVDLEDAPDPPTPQEIEEQRVAKTLSDRQDFLRTWADKIHLTLRLVDNERNAVQYGDGVYLLGWDTDRERATVAVMDPGFYFPVLPDSIDTYDYPERVHFAWEIPATDSTGGKVLLRRITYELRPLMWEPELDEDGEVVGAIAPEGSTVSADGVTLTRQYPWDTEGEPSRLSCYMTDATWVLDDIDHADNFDSLSEANASYASTSDGKSINKLDLLIDFIPVVHVPNSPPGGHHFGRSTLGQVLQILDDLQNADTDAQSASATTGSPIIGVAGTSIKDGDPTVDGGRKRSIVVKPGAVWDLGAEGRLDSIDTSGNLAELRNYVNHLRDRMSVNSRLPGSVLGTVKPSEVPSGYALSLSFGPLDALVRQMRLTRSVKYPLLLKMVQRLYQANGGLEPGETPEAEMRFGSYLPADKSGVLELVKSGVGAGVLSLETGVGMLADAGFPIEDIAEEISRIQSRDFQGANDLADVTGDVNAVADYLGIKRPPAEAPIPRPPLPNDDEVELDPVTGQPLAPPVPVQGPPTA